jgi:hypothetical protein
MCTNFGCVRAKLGVVFVPAVRRFYHLEIFVSPAVVPRSCVDCRRPSPKIDTFLLGRYSENASTKLREKEREGKVHMVSAETLEVVKVKKESDGSDTFRIFLGTDNQASTYVTIRVGLKILREVCTAKSVKF